MSVVRSVTGALRVKVARHFLNWLEADQAIEQLSRTKTAASQREETQFKFELLRAIAKQEKQAFAKAISLLQRAARPVSQMLGRNKAVLSGLGGTAVGGALGGNIGHQVGYNEGIPVGDKAGYRRGSQEGGDNYARNLFSELHRLGQGRDSAANGGLQRVFNAKPTAPKPTATAPKPTAPAPKPAAPVAKQAGLVGAIGKGLMRGAGALGRTAAAGTSALGKQTAKAMYSAAPHVGTAATQAIKGTGRAIGTAAHGISQGQGVMSSAGKGLASAVPHMRQAGSAAVQAAGSHPLNMLATGAAGTLAAQQLPGQFQNAADGAASGFNNAVTGARQWAGDQLVGAGNALRPATTPAAPAASPAAPTTATAATGSPSWMRLLQGT